jgi:hypothetical protein
VRERHTVGRKIWKETLKNMKNEKCKSLYLGYSEKIEVMVNEKYGKNSEKRGN